jgi:hypothetical protein
MKIGTTLIVVGVGMMSSMAVARAQTSNTPAPPESAANPTDEEPASPAVETTPTSSESTSRFSSWMTKIGAAMMLGGGWEHFTQSVPQAVTNPGGSWDARIAAGTRQFVGLEAAYVGGSRSVTVLGTATNANLVNNGLEGVLRLNLPVVLGRSLIEPFGFAGLGWQHYSTSSSFRTADITSTDDVMTMPYGAGLMYSYRMVMIDGRITWHETYYNNMFAALGAKLNTFGVGGNLGVAF